MVPAGPEDLCPLSGGFDNRQLDRLPGPAPSAVSELGLSPKAANTGGGAAHSHPHRHGHYLPTSDSAADETSPSPSTSEISPAPRRSFTS